MPGFLYRGDCLLVAQPKPRKRIQDRALLKHIRQTVRNCERCGRNCTSYIHGGPHHIKYRSQGGDDIKENLIRLCIDCHTDIHNAKYHRRELIEIVAKREGKYAREIAEIIGVVL